MKDFLTGFAVGALGAYVVAAYVSAMRELREYSYHRLHAFPEDDEQW